MRHGERADEVSSAERSAWRQTPAYREGRYYDPPLTRNGHVQASTAGRYLNSLGFSDDKGVANSDSDGDPERSPATFDRIYISPLIRAVQTAYCISRQMGLPLQVQPSKSVRVI